VRKLAMQIVVVSLAVGGGMAQDGGHVAIRDALTSPDMAERTRCVNEIRDGRRTTIEGLLQVLPAERADIRGTDRDPFVVAVSLLGELRAREATARLLEHLDYEINTRWGKAEAGSRYPCALALSKIGGVEVANAVAQQIAEEPDAKRRAMRTWLIYAVLGEPLGKVQLELQLRGRPEDDGAKRIRAAIEDLKKGNALVPK